MTAPHARQPQVLPRPACPPTAIRAVLAANADGDILQRYDEDLDAAFEQACEQRALAAVRSVVVAGREDDDLCFGDEVDEAVLVIDPPGPCPGQVVLERLGLADSGERISPDVLDQLVDPREHLAIGLEPGRVVLPALVLEYQSH